MQENLDPDVAASIWDQDVFKASRYPLQSLANALNQSDFGVFICAPDDISHIRGNRLAVPRDNVVFESGFFAGSLGYENVFFIVPRGTPRIHLPSDLGALTVLEYDPPSQRSANLNAVLGPSCNKIRKLILEAWNGPHMRRSGLHDPCMFTELGTRFSSLLRAAKEVTLYFIHSRRWREDHSSQIKAFLERPNTKLTVYLPDLFNAELVKTLVCHFQGDEPELRDFIANSCRYYLGLRSMFGRKVKVRLFNAYPTYSFYRFDDTFVLALYPTTPEKRDVPAFEVDGDGQFGAFVLDDLSVLKRNSRVLDDPSQLDLIAGRSPKIV